MMYYLRTFRCPVCGERRTAPKKQRSEAGHIKDLWCSRCKDIRKFELLEDTKCRTS